MTLDGQKDLLGIWIAETEGAKFCLSVLTELKTRGVADILIAFVGSLRSLPDAIASEQPEAQIQLCIVHMVSNSLRYVSYKDRKQVTADPKLIYQAMIEEQGLHALAAFATIWDAQYPAISKTWSTHWAHLSTLYQHPPDIRKVIYTTNAIESLNSVLRKAMENHRVFPTD